VCVCVCVCVLCWPRPDMGFPYTIYIYISTYIRRIYMVGQNPCTVLRTRIRWEIFIYGTVWFIEVRCISACMAWANPSVVCVSGCVCVCLCACAVRFQALNIIVEFVSRCSPRGIYVAVHIRKADKLWLGKHCKGCHAKSVAWVNRLNFPGSCDKKKLHGYLSRVFVHSLRKSKSVQESLQEETKFTWLFGPCSTPKLKACNLLTI